VRRSEFDVVLMDIQMPELDGVQATRQIRALGAGKRDVPIIAMTAHAMAGAREEYIAAGMNDYISKPVQPALLLSKLADLAGKTAPRGPQLPSRDARTSTLPTLDLDKLGELAAALPMAKLEGFIALYLADVESHLLRICEAARNGDFAAVARDSHAVVGTSGTLGAMQTSALARRVEEACRSGEQDRVHMLIAELREAGKASSAALRSWANDRPAQRPAMAS
jgi:CheY-like chemotaxis protein